MCIGSSMDGIVVYEESWARAGRKNVYCINGTLGLCYRNSTTVFSYHCGITCATSPLVVRYAKGICRRGGCIPAAEVRIPGSGETRSRDRPRRLNPRTGPVALLGFFSDSRPADLAGNRFCRNFFQKHLFIAYNTKRAPSHNKERK